MVLIFLLIQIMWQLTNQPSDWLTDWLEQSLSPEDLSYSRNPSPFMEPQGSLPYLPEPATGPYTKADVSIPQPSTLFS